MPQAAPQQLQDCPLPVALETIGERWSFLILRGAMCGISHFEEFQSSLGIARNILSNRLVRLVEKGMLSRHVMDCDKRKVEYRLTDKGHAFVPVMVALRQWAEKWEAPGVCNHALVDCRDGMPLREISIMAHDGRSLEPDDIVWLARSIAERQAADALVLP
ncbi:MAG: helix-turn-helix domain-containing protein [Sphingobium sp.]